MEQGRARQPGHEGGVFHRIPEPPAAPAKLVIGPPGAEHDSQGQEDPGRHGPGTGPARPGGIEPARHQGGDGEGEGHREAHVAHVEHGGMEDEAGILQQRVEVAPIHREVRQGAGEGVRSEQHEGGEAHRDEAEHPQHPRHCIERQATAEQGHGRGPAPQGQHPEQQGTLVGPPHRRDAVLQRQQAVGVGSHVLHGEVVVDEGPGEAEEGEQQQQKLAVGERTGRRHHAEAPPLGPEQRVAAQQQSGGKGQDQCELPQFRDHGWLPFNCAATRTGAQA